MRVVAIVLMLIAFPAEASEFGPGFFFAMALGLLAFIWPLLMPLLFIRNTKNKIKLYFKLLLAAIGLALLFYVPVYLFWLYTLATTAVPTTGTDLTEIVMPSARLFFISQLLAFATSFWTLPKAKAWLASRPVQS
jgi:hypothetical protein